MHYANQSRVSHKTRGFGTVLHTDEDGWVKIAWDNKYGKEDEMGSTYSAHHNGTLYPNMYMIPSHDSKLSLASPPRSKLEQVYDKIQHLEEKYNALQRV